jgi:hypothetical protein
VTSDKEKERVGHIRFINQAEVCGIIGTVRVFEQRFYYKACHKARIVYKVLFSATGIFKKETTAK